MSRSGNDWGAKINGGLLDLTNDAGVPTNANGWVYGYRDINTLPGWNTTLSSNSGIIIWEFNMQQMRPDPSGFSAGSYGVAFVLAGTSTTVATEGSGYAILLGQLGTTDPIRLASFNNGLQGTLNNIITSNTTGLTDFGVEYLSIKVTYTPSSNTWALFLRNDGSTAFTDPTSGTELISQGAAVNNTYTSTTGMRYIGGYWQGSTTANQKAFFDNVYLSTIAPSTVTFDGNGATSGSMLAQTARSATNLTSNVFSRNGYTFGGWATSPSSTTVAYADAASYPFTSSTTLYAIWAANTLTVTYDSQGGSAISNGSTTTGGSIAVSPGTPTRTGYTFNGWFVAPTGGSAISFPYTHGQTANFTLYAQWTVNTLTVTYDSQGGSAIANGSTTTGGSIAASPGTPTRTGNIFNGWFVASTGGSALSFPYTHGQTANFTLYAQWCTNVGLASATATASSICANATTTITASGLTGTNAVVNWYTAQNGGGTNVGTGLTSNAVAPGTYYAYATGDCGSPVEIQVVVGTKTNVGLTSASANNSPICLSATTNLTYSGLTGTNASVTWYDGSGGTGNTYGTGTPSGDVGPGTYYAYANGDCGSPVQIQVVVGATSVNIFSGSGNWTDVSKWGCEVVPSAGDNFALAASANAILNTSLNVSGTMTLDATSTLTINPGRELAVASGGAVNFNGAQVTLKSDASGTAAIGKIIGTLSGATNVTVERYIPVYNSSFSPSHIKAWRMLSVPTYTTAAGGQTIRQAWQEGGVLPPLNNYGLLIGGAYSTGAAATAQGFDTYGSATLQKYSGTAWVNVTNTNATKLDTTGAYFLFIRGNRSVTITTPVTDNSKDVTLRTTGRIYQGNGVTGAALPTSFSVAGNIYPSAIDFAQLQSNNSSKINGVFYLWDPRRKNGSSLGSYQTFSATNSYGCTPGGGSFTLNQVNTTIQSGQGFFVIAKNPGAGERLVFDENIKVSGSSNNAFRPTLPANRLVKIDTRLLDTDNSEVADGNTVVFSANYANAVDGDDAQKLINSGENFGIQKGNTRLAVEGRQPAAAGDEILFAAGNLKEKTYVLDIAAQNLDAENLTATLEDRYTQSSTLLDLNGSTRVPVAVDGNAASKAADRFRIVFGKPVLTGKAGFTVAPNPVEGSNINVRFMNQAAGRYTARILGTDGKVLQTAVLEHTGGNATQILRMNTKFAVGTYQLELTGVDKVSRVITVLMQ
jgi:uncharacterized repeat protein (TIGR02543 family)